MRSVKAVERQQEIAVCQAGVGIGAARVVLARLVEVGAGGAVVARGELLAAELLEDLRLRRLGRALGFSA